jgi:hypothetical protein
LRAAVDAAVEDQAHPVGSTQVEVVSDHLLEEDPGGDGPSSIWVKENSACRIDRS